MGFFEKFKAGFIRFMQGRNGPDQLGSAAIWTALVLCLLSMFTGLGRAVGPVPGPVGIRGVPAVFAQHGQAIRGKPGLSVRPGQSAFRRAPGRRAAEGAQAIPLSGMPSV